MAERLTAGQIELVTISGWGIVGQVVAFLEALGFFALLDVAGTGFQRVLLPIARLILTYRVKILLGIGSIDLVPVRLVRDRALLRLLGYTTTRIQAGFCARGRLAVGPLHRTTPADAVERLSAAALETPLTATAKRLVRRGTGTASRGHRHRQPGARRPGCQ